jgi:phosphoribosyl 1,2-cyclic phosphodiesterase
VGLSELPCKLHEVPGGEVDIGEFRVSSALVCHPGPTVGYRISAAEGVLTYLPDHEPALGATPFKFLQREWTSGGSLAAGADLLIHDSQYDTAEYVGHVGWGHSSLKQTLDFGALTEVKHLVPFHHDPAHTDADLDRLMAAAMEDAKPAYQVTPGLEGATFEL